MSTEPAKILYCSFDVIPEPTGSSARVVEQLKALGPAFNVDALTVKSPDHSHIERFCGARLLRVPVGAGDLPARTLAFERAVRRQLESDEYQLVHFTDPFGGYPLCELRAQHNYKVVYEANGFPSIEVRYLFPHLEGDRRFLARLRRQELFCLMNADAVVAGSQVTQALVESYGVSRERVAVAPAFADLEPFDHVRLPRPDRTPMRVLYIGNQNSWQGLSTLLFATSIAVQTVPIRLAIVGPRHASWSLQLEETIRYRNLTGVVELAGPVPPADLPAVIGSADVGVAPLERTERNTTQGAPVAKIAHYLAAGRALIASDLPVVREITSEACAAYHKPGDENDLAARLVELAKDPARRVEMGRVARSFAQKRLSAAAARKRVLGLHAGLLGVPTPELPAVADASGGASADPMTNVSGSGRTGTPVRAREDNTQVEQAAVAERVTDLFSLGSRSERSGPHLFAAPEAHTDPALRAPAPAQAPPAPEPTPVASVVIPSDSLVAAAAAAENPPAEAASPHDGAARAPAAGVGAEAAAARVASDSGPVPDAPVASPAEALAVAPRPPGVAPAAPAESSVVLLAEPRGPDSPVEIGAGDFDEIQTDPSGAGQGRVPRSGTDSAEEWLGHALFGYAPFGILLTARTTSGEQMTSPIPRTKSGDHGAVDKKA